MPAAKKAEVTVNPELTEVTVNYSFGMKVQVIKYEESADFHASETRKYNVAGMPDEAVTEFVNNLRGEIYERIAQDVLDRADKAVNEQKY